MREIRPQAEQGIVWRNPKSIFKYNGWPSVCRDERGVLYATASSFRIQHVDPVGKNAMFVSFNDGKTWTRPIVVNDSYLDDRDTGVASLGDGKMIISWFSLRYDDDCAGHANFEWEKPYDKETILSMGRVCKLLPQEEMKSGAYVKVSDDYGVSWSEPIAVPMTAPHGPSRLSDGRAVFLGKDMFPREDGKSHIASYISADGGRTWEKTGDVPLPPDLTWDHLHEPHVIELPSGRLLGAIRVHCRQVEPVNTCYTTYSDDGGKTWSMPKSTDVDGLPPHLFLHSSGAVILSYACRASEKKSERAAVSYDGGETWSDDYVLNDNIPFSDLGYPATTECADGSLITVYYQCYPGDDFCSVLQTKWKLEK